METDADFAFFPQVAWIVVHREGLDNSFDTLDCAASHAALMAEKFPELAPWRVAKYRRQPNG